MDYLKKYEEHITTGEPIPYKEFMLYPVLWKDAYKFVESFDVLAIEKDEIPNADIISMSYLKFVLFCLCQGEQAQVWLTKLENVLSVCLKADIEQVSITVEGESTFLKIGEKLISERDFDVIRKIILYQNVPNYDDVYIDPEVRKSINAYYAAINKDIEPPSLERLKLILLSSTGLSGQEIINMPYRECQLLLSTINDKTEYAITRIVSHIPYVDSKNLKLDHWIYKKKSSKYEDAFVDAEAFKDKFANVSG